MFNKFFKFLKGYVIIRVSGADAERFVNICIRRGADISGIKAEKSGALIMRVSIPFFLKLRPVARKTGVHIHIIKRGGAFMMKRLYGRRYAFLLGALFMIVFFAVTSQFIWVVELDGVYESNEEQIIQILSDCGIKPGASKRSLPPPDEIKSRLINETGTLSWAWVYIEGARARAVVYEKRTAPETADKSIPCDIVAACDAFIKRIDVKNGERAVENGTAVLKGDVLISGNVPVFTEGEEEKYMQVHAEGVTEAVTYREASANQSLFRELRIKTGRKKTYYSLEIFGKLFELYSDTDCGFENFDTSDNRRELTLPFFGYSGLCLNTRTYEEVEPVREQITEEAAALYAKERLEEEIAKELYSSPRLEDSSLTWERISSDTINVRLRMKFIEDIGIKTPINNNAGSVGDAAADIQTQ